MKKTINLIIIFLLILIILSNISFVFGEDIDSLYGGDDISSVDGEAISKSTKIINILMVLFLNCFFVAVQSF